MSSQSTDNIELTDDNEELTEEEATPLHWFFVEVFTKMILGEKAELIDRPKKAA